MSLAEKLVYLRKQKGLTQMDLAERLNVSRQAISRWEVGAAIPSMENLKTLGKLYGVSVDFLLDDISDTGNIPEVKEIPVCFDEPMPSFGKKRRRWTLAILATVILGVIAVWVLMTQIDRSSKTETPTPYSDLDTDSNGHSEETFQFDW